MRNTFDGGKTHHMDAKQIHKAYLAWYFRYYGSYETDQELIPYLNSEIRSYSPGQSWLKKTRNALFLSTTSVAAKLEVSRSAYAKLEKSEINAGISLNALARAANEMDCELVYAIRPKKQIRFSETIWQVLMKSSINHNRVTSQPEVRKSATLAAVAIQKMNEPEFRRKQGWSERTRN
jgi:transcriptional regulator with XRE-family HTH domain